MLRRILPGLFLITCVLPLAAERDAGAQVRTEPALRRAIEDPHRSLRHFYRSLTHAASRRSGAVSRVMMYTESTNATDRVTSTLRRALQDRFGDAGKGFVPISPGWPTQRHRDVEWSHEGRWRSWVVNRRGFPGDRYGLGGVVTSQRNSRARASFATVAAGPVGRAVSRFQLFYQSYPDGGDVQLRVDDGDVTTVPTHDAGVTDRVHDIHLPDGAHQLEVTPAATTDELRLYGVVMERDRPGVVVDGLMLVGAFTRVLLQFDPQHWRSQIQMRQPDLMVFWMGGNDAASRTTGWTHSRYVRQYTQAVERARRGRPEASCLIVSVMDAGERVGEYVRTRRRIPRMVAAQRQVAGTAGCAFFNLFEASGGRGTMARWRRSIPRRSEGDYQHLTAAGAQQVGNTIYRALMQGYAEHRGQS